MSISLDDLRDAYRAGAPRYRRFLLSLSTDKDDASTWRVWADRFWLRREWSTVLMAYDLRLLSDGCVASLRGDAERALGALSDTRIKGDPVVGRLRALVDGRPGSGLLHTHDDGEIRLAEFVAYASSFEQNEWLVALAQICWDAPLPAAIDAQTLERQQFFAYATYIQELGEHLQANIDELDFAERIWWHHADGSQLGVLKGSRRPKRTASDRELFRWTVERRYASARITSDVESMLERFPTLEGLRNAADAHLLRYETTKAKAGAFTDGVRRWWKTLQDDPRTRTEFLETMPEVDPQELEDLLQSELGDCVHIANLGAGASPNSLAMGLSLAPDLPSWVTDLWWKTGREYVTGWKEQK